LKEEEEDDGNHNWNLQMGGGVFQVTQVRSKSNRYNGGVSYPYGWMTWHSARADVSWCQENLEFSGFRLLRSSHFMDFLFRSYSILLLLLLSLVLLDTTKPRLSVTIPALANIARSFHNKREREQREKIVKAERHKRCVRISNL
jgi:hypothetical protein